MRIVYSLLLAGMFILGFFLCRSFICNATTGSSKAATASMVPAITNEKCIVTLNFNDNSFKVKSKDNFRFLMGSDEMQEVSAELADKSSAVAKYLDSRSSRMLTIEGLYTKEETFTSEDDEIDNLGQARAINVKSYFEDLGVEGDQIMTTGVLAKESCYKDSILMRGINVSFKSIK